MTLLLQHKCDLGEAAILVLMRGGPIEHTHWVYLGQRSDTRRLRRATVLNLVFDCLQLVYMHVRLDVMMLWDLQILTCLIA